MEILGIGIDLVEIARLEESRAKFGERFLEKIFTSGETAYCLSHSNPGPHLAARFAVKEAVSKAFGTGIGAELGWHDMEVTNEASGRPIVTFHGKGLDLCKKHGVSRCLISLSHTASHAVAQAILVR